MSDLPQQNTIIQYLADGITTVYVVPFFTPLETDGTPDLDVFTQAADATPVPESDIKQWNVDYTYTENLDPITGGTITFLPGHVPALGYVVTIVRNVSASLDVEFSQAQTFSGITLDDALDKLLLISQQNKSYALERNISYIVNSYLPDSTIAANVNVPILASGQVWFGSADGVIAATLEQSSDTSTLRSELANEQPVTNGAALVGYYDTVNNNPTTVAEQLTYLTGLVLAGTPTGAMLDFGGTSAPVGFLLCDGSAVSRVTYDNLFDAIGTNWGIGDGSTTFNLPDFRRRTSIGSGGSGTSIIGNSVGDTCDSETEALTDADQLPPHTHNYTQTTFPTSITTTAGATPILTPLNVIAATASTGTSVPFNIMQPSAVVLKIIRY